MEALNKHGSKISTYKILYIVHIFKFLLAPFESRMVNLSRHSESLNFRKNSEFGDIFLR